MAYCASGDVDDFLGQTLEDQQLEQADVLCQAASSFIDAATGRTWTGTPVLNEHHVATGGARPDSWLWATGWWGNEDLHLAQPVQSVTSVNVIVNGQASALEYDVIDARSGWIRVRGGWYGRDIYVSYVPLATVPADIKLAATMLVAHWLQPALHPERFGLSELSIGDRELVQRLANPVDVPVQVTAILSQYVLPVFA